MSGKRDDESPRLDPHEHANFRRYVGKILYAAQVRPDASTPSRSLLDAWPARPRTTCAPCAI
eukprot:6313338-Heterocapsa_arctica.AAC.1